MNIESIKNIEYEHLIVSRINVKWRKESKDEYWLKDRIKILNKILRPSINGQINKNFKFITLWGYDPDDGIDGEIQIKIESEGTKDIYDELVLKLKNYINKDNVLLTRIDSDNCMSYDFVEKLQNNIINNVPYFYDINHIEVYYMNNGLKTKQRYASTSGFISVMESKQNFKCIPYKYPHDNIRHIIEGINLDLDVLLTVHNSNVAPKGMRGKEFDFNLKKYNIII